MCEEGDVKVSCREKHCQISWQTCDEDMCGGGDVKVSCRENTAICLDEKKAQREGVCCEKQCEGKLKTNL